MTETWLKPVVWLLMAVSLTLLTGGCSDQAGRVSGTWTGMDENAAAPVAVTIELQPDGKGFWSVGMDNAPFRWDLRLNTLRLHTPSGGVVEGEIQDQTIDISLPGTGIIHFQKSR